MERIEINGEWYVKESSIQKPIEELDLIPTHTESLILESSGFCFEATICYRDNDEGFYDQVDIEVTDKRFARREDWKTENWDSTEWFKGVYQNNPESIESACEFLDDEGLKIFKCLLKHLIDRKWLII